MAMSRSGNVVSELSARIILVIPGLVNVGYRQPLAYFQVSVDHRSIAGEKPDVLYKDFPQKKQA